MTLRAGHGKHAGSPRIEVMPADEALAGVHAPAQGEARGERTPDGRWLPGTRTAQSRGGRATKHRTVLSHSAGLSEVAAAPDFAPYLSQAKAFAKAECARLSRIVGGGECGAGPASMVTTASLQLAASRYLFAKAGAGDTKAFDLASRLGDASRQNLLAAHELVAREAKARRASNPLAAFDATAWAEAAKPVEAPK